MDNSKKTSKVWKYFHYDIDDKSLVVCKLCLALNKSKKDASFKHHGNTTNQTRHTKIHHPNQRKSIDPPKPNQSKIKIDEQKISSFTNETQQTKCSKKIDSLN